MHLPKSRLECFVWGILTPLAPGIMLISAFRAFGPEQSTETAPPQMAQVNQPKSILRAPVINHTINLSPIPTETAVPNDEVAATQTPWPTETKFPTPPLAKEESDRDYHGVSSQGLIWPFSGPISSPYGPSHPLGIDIDGYEGTRSREGEPVVAATSGEITFAGCCLYGNYVVVLSPEGIETLYGHLDALSVAEGDSVEQGQEVGKLGDTGYSTGPHLHFEVIDNGVRVNPVDYLP